MRTLHFIRCFTREEICIMVQMSFGNVDNITCLWNIRLLDYGNIASKTLHEKGVNY